MYYMRLGVGNTTVNLQSFGTIVPQIAGDPNARITTNMRCIANTQEPHPPL